MTTGTSLYSGTLKAPKLLGAIVLAGILLHPSMLNSGATIAGTGGAVGHVHEHSANAAQPEDTWVPHACLTYEQRYKAANDTARCLLLP